MFNFNKIISILLKVVIILALIFLVVSIFKSIYYYQYDNDEFYHVQEAYLIASGFKPHTSFYFIFSSIFHRVIIPVFLFFGFSFATLAKVRVFMMFLFAIRVFLTAVLISKVFNRRTALLFVPLFLFDPFTIFSSMQIRPDNLMMMVYTLALTVFVVGFLKSSKTLIFVSGMIFGLSFLILLKITPQIIVFFGAYTVYSFLNRKFKNLIFLLDGFVLTLVLFSIYYVIDGSFLSMFKQVFVIPFTLSNTIINKVYYGFFHQPNNAFIYGLMGKPLTWMYVWILPLLASGGAYLTISKGVDKKKQFIQFALIVNFIVQYLFLLKLDTAFIQYYIPLQWYLALFAAVLLDDLIFIKFTSGIIKWSLKGAFFVIFLALVFTSIKANNARSLFKSEYQTAQFSRIWAVVPEKEAVFPSFLFRPIAHPMIEEQYNKEDFNKLYSYMTDSFPSYISSFEKNKLKYLIIKDSLKFNNLELGMEEYIANHYKQIDSEMNLYKRIK